MFPVRPNNVPQFEGHTLRTGSAVILTTKLGVRTYYTASVSKVSDTDTSGLDPSAGKGLTALHLDRLSVPVHVESHSLPDIPEHDEVVSVDPLGGYPPR